jgi:parvulin-like peptidyl-prolyl isomerase
MTKKTRKRASKELTRKQRSRLERERQIERWLIWGVTAVAILIVGVLAYGFITEKVVKAREAVALVGGTPIRTAEFQARVRFMRMQMNGDLQALYQQQQLLDPTDSDSQFYLEYIEQSIKDLQSQLAEENSLIIGEQALDQLVQEELIRQEAERRGLTVTSEELQEAIELSFGYERNPATPTPSPVPVATPLATSTDALTPTPTLASFPTPTPMTEEAFREQYNSFLDALKEVDVSEQQLRSWFEASLLLERLQEQMRAEVPATADQVNVRYLSIDDGERANEMVTRLAAGEEFEALADELLADEEVSGYDSETGWVPRSILEGNLGAEVADVAFSLGVGEHSDPLLSGNSLRYLVIEVVGHEERELDEYARDQLGAEAFQEWLAAQETLVERRTYRDRVPTKP